jgi:hypothetical protein
MKENKDRHQVVMAREMYDELYSMAATHARNSEQDSPIKGSPDSVISRLAKVRRHVQKYNTPVHEDRQAQVKKDAAEYRRLRELVIDLVVNHVGQIVWVKSQAPAPRGLDVRPTFYIAHEVVGRSELGKLAVKVAPVVGGPLSDKHVSSLTKELPERYTYQTEGMGAYIAFDPNVVQVRDPYGITVRTAEVKKE